MKVINAFFYPKPSKESEFVGLLTNLTINSRFEEGCIRYEFLKDAIDGNKYVLIEQWESAKAHENHLTYDYFKKFQNEIDELLLNKSEIVMDDTK